MLHLQYRILNVPVDVQTLDEALLRLQQWIATAKRSFVSTCTVYTVMTAQDDPAIMQALQQADMVTADGMPLVWLQKNAGYRQAGRVYGPDLFLALCAQTQTQTVRHYFLGGNPGVAEKLTQTLKAKYPGIQIAGHSAPDVRGSLIKPEAELIETVNAANADVVWVGLGSPKQDLWMNAYRPHLNATLLIGVGAAFDFIAGTKQQAPLWMRRSGLEWLFRLLSEPNRLWKRYVVYNSRFVWAISRQTIKARFGARA